MNLLRLVGFIIKKFVTIHGHMDIKLDVTLWSLHRFAKFELMYYLEVSISTNIRIYVGHLESKERLRIQPAQLFHFS